MNASMSIVNSKHCVDKQQWATRMIFFLNGFGLATKAPLIPMLRERLQITDDILGMLLLCVGIGSLITMPISGMLSSKYGCRRVLTVCCTFFAIFILGILLVDNLYLAAIILFLFGSVIGSTDVVMNIAAILVENASGKRIMSGMHAFYSIGGFVGAGLYGFLTGIIGTTSLQSTLISISIMLAIVLVFAHHLSEEGGGGDGKIIALPHGIVIAVGAVCFIAFLVEGATMDWSGVYLTSTLHWDMSLAGMGFTIFSLAMLLMRLLGDRTVEKLGAKTVVVGGSLISAAGFFAIILSDSVYAIYMGFFAIGMGCANIVPVLFTLLGKQHVMPIGDAVTASSTMGYLGILIGPAIIGFVSHATSLSGSFFMLGLLVMVQAVMTYIIYHKMH